MVGLVPSLLLCCCVMVKVASLEGQTTSRVEKQWQEEQKKYMEEYANPQKYFKDVGKKLGLGDSEKFSLQNIAQTIKESTQKYMKKYKPKNESVPNVQDADLRKELGVIRDRVRDMKMEGPMSQRNAKDKTLSEKVAEKKDAEREEEGTTEEKDDGETEGKWSWGKIFGVFGKGLKDIVLSGEEEEAGDRRRRSLLEGKKQKQDDQRKSLENNVSDLSRYFAGVGKALGKGDDVNPVLENLSQMIQKNGKKFLDELSQKAKKTLDEKDVKKTLEDLQSKFQENIKEPMTKLKEIQAEVDNAISEETKNETAEGTKNWSLMRILAVAARGVQDFLENEPEIDSKKEEHKKEDDEEVEETLRRSLRNTDEEWGEQLPGMGSNMGQEGNTYEEDSWGTPEPTTVETNEEGQDGNGGMENGEGNEGEDGGLSMGNKVEEEEKGDEEGEKNKKKSGKNDRKERKEKRKKNKEERKERKGERKDRKEDRMEKKEKKEEKKEERKQKKEEKKEEKKEKKEEKKEKKDEKKEERKQKKEERKEKKEEKKEKKEEKKEKKEEKKEKKQERKETKEEKKEEKKEKKEERKERKEERKRKKEERQKKKEEKGGQCLHKDTATKDEDVGIFPCRKEMCADLPEQMLRRCKKTCLCRDDIKLETNCDVVKPVPSGDPRFNEFYKKHTIAHGLPILSSDKPDDKSLKRACRVVEFLLLDRKDIRLALFYANAKAAVIGKNEKTRTIPEHSFLPADWDETTRGVGGMVDNPISTAGEENLLCDTDVDKYPNEDIFLHEFTHGIMLIGAAQVIPNFEQRVKDMLKKAKEKKLWEDTYADDNFMEYFAEGAQSYFNVNDYSETPNNIHNHVNTREKLRTYDPVLYSLLEEVFPCGNVIWKRCDEKNNVDKPSTAPRRDCRVETGKQKRKRGRGKGKRPRRE